MERAWEDEKCNFCGKMREEVGHLIKRADGGPTICDECISLCIEMTYKHMRQQRDELKNTKTDLVRTKRQLESAQENFEREENENGQLRDEREELRKELEAVQKEAFKLSAVHCDQAVGDEHGHLTCEPRESLEAAQKKLVRIERICYSVLKWAQAEENKTATHAEANVMQAAMLATVGMVVWEQGEGKAGPNPVQQYGDKLAKENVRLEEIVKGSCQACGDCDPHRIGKWGY